MINVTIIVLKIKQFCILIFKMQQFKIFILVVSFMLGSVITKPQTHYNSWFKTTIGYSFSAKIKAEVEYHHRNQSDYNANNPFDKCLMNAIRTMVYYKTNEHLQFAISPFAYFNNNKIILSPTDANAPKNNEIRFSAFVETQQQIIKKFFLQNRTGIEYRVYETPNKNVTRIRNRIALRYDASSKFSFLFANELFVNASGIPSLHLFDHNRIVALATYKLTTNLKLEFGYIHSNRIPKISNDLILEENFLFNIGITLPKKIK